MTHDAKTWANIDGATQTEVLHAISKLTQLPASNVFHTSVKNKNAKELCAEIDRLLLNALGFSIAPAEKQFASDTSPATAVLQSLKTLAEAPITPETPPHKLHADAKQLFENLTSLRQEAIAAAKIEGQSMIDMINGCNKALTAHFPESHSVKFR